MKRAKQVCIVATILSALVIVWVCWSEARQDKREADAAWALKMQKVEKSLEAGRAKMREIYE